jgi:hypothetical protein
VPSEDHGRQANVDELSSQLSEGLKTCRTMVANYRAMLGAGANDNLEAQIAANDAEQDRDEAGEPC